MKSFLPRLLLAISLLCGTVNAQSDTPKTIAVSIYCFRYAPNLEDIYLQASADSYTKVELSTANLIGPNKAVMRGNQVFLYRQVTTKEGVVTWPAVAQVNIPADCRKALILLLPAAPEDALPYRGLVFPHNNKDFPMGSMKMVNLSTYPVRGAVGIGKVNIRSGGIETFRQTGEPGESQPVLFEYQTENRWQRMAATRWSVRDDRRSLICIFQDPVTKRMNMRSIPDRTMMQGAAE